MTEKLSPENEEQPTQVDNEALPEQTPIGEPAPDTDAPDTQVAAEPTETVSVPSDDVIILPRTAFNYIIVALVFFVVGALMGSFVFPAGGVGGEQTATLPEDIDAIVRSAVADAFQDAGIEVAQSGPEQGERYEVVLNEDDPFQGNPDGPITIIEFSDFLCGFCGRFANETLPLIMEEYGDQVRFVYMDFPVISPQASPVIASAAECAHDQDKFWEYHDLLFDNSGSISSADALYDFAEQLELDIDTFTTCFEEGVHLDEIREDQAYARELGLRGTPAFFINGRFVNGAVPFETFQEIIDEELAELG